MRHTTLQKGTCILSEASHWILEWTVRLTGIEGKNERLYDTEHLASASIFRRCIHSCLQEECPAGVRDLLTMSDIQGLSYSEIGLILGVPASSAEVMVEDARAQFKDAMMRKKCALLVYSGPCCVCEGARELGSEEALRLRGSHWRRQNQGPDAGPCADKGNSPCFLPSKIEMVSKMLRTLSVTEMYVPWFS